MTDQHEITRKERLLFRRRIGPARRIMGLDMGSKRIGVALSDLALSIASPLEVVKRGKFMPTAETLFNLMDKHGADGFVIGLPLEMTGKEGPAAQSAREFGRNLLKLRDVPLLYVDERLTTAEVERVLIEADSTRARRGEVIDKMAAAVILQTGLDMLYELQFADDDDDD
ncbi:MAG: Holliday junction resolvase RuvX [Alphaproteobacteria bacterium]